VGPTDFVVDTQPQRRRPEQRAEICQRALRPARQRDRHTRLWELVQPAGLRARPAADRQHRRAAAGRVPRGGDPGGQSDGQCDPAGGVRAWNYSDWLGWPTSAQALFDPLWGIDDPAAGHWFSRQALQLA
jgi:hypothetical protein